MMLLSSVYPRSDMSGLKSERLARKLKKKYEKKSFCLNFLRKKELHMCNSMCVPKNRFKNVFSINIKKYNFEKNMSSDEDKNSTSTQFNYSEAATAASHVELAPSMADSFATIEPEKPEVLELHPDELAAVMSPEMDEFFKPEQKPMKIPDRKMIFPGAAGYNGKRAKFVDQLSPEESRAIEKEKAKGKEAMEGVTPRKSARSTPVKKSWSNSKKSSNWGFAGVGAFSSTDIRYRDEQATEPVKLKARKNGPVATGPVWPVDDKKTVIKRRANFQASAIGLMVKDLKVEKVKPAEKPEKSPENPPHSNPNNPVQTALRRGCPPVMIWSPRKPDSIKNPVLSVDRNTSKKGKRFTHKDYNKTPKKSTDAETETEPIKARHVQLCSPVKMGGAIIDPNQYLLEQFTAYERVPELETEVELQKLQKEAVMKEFRGMREKIRGLQLELGGAKREREDAVECELLAVKERDAAVEKEKESARLLKMWQERAKNKKDETNRMRRKFEGLQEKLTGKMGRAVARLAGATTDKEVDSACERVAEMISRDPEMEAETDWSEDDAAC